MEGRGRKEVGVKLWTSHLKTNRENSGDESGGVLKIMQIPGGGCTGPEESCVISTKPCIIWTAQASFCGCCCKEAYMAIIIIFLNAFLLLNLVVFSEILLPINPAEIIRGTEMYPVSKYFMKEHMWLRNAWELISLACECKVRAEIEAGVWRRIGRALKWKPFPISWEFPYHQSSQR